MLRIFIGYDPNETVAYHVCVQSILSRCSLPVSITPINRKNMKFFYRQPEYNQSTEFSFSRFLTPYLAGNTGQAIFMDCDMLVRCDIAEILDECDLHHDVFVVKHDYTPKSATKFLGNKQEAYPKKNWSSLMVFNCFSSRCRQLTPSVVAKESGAYLHQFDWTNGDRIGELKPEWNHLVGEYDPNPSAKIAHFTLGSPCFEGYEKQEYADEWREEFFQMTHSSNPAYNVELRDNNADN